MTKLSRKPLSLVWIALALIAALGGYWRLQSRVAISSAAPLTPADAATSARMLQAYGKLPLSFERNQGQADPSVQFLSHGGGQSLRLEAAKVVLNLRGEKRTSTLSLNFLDANPAPRIEGEAELPGKSNYLTGADPNAWRTNIPTYAKVRYREVWPGVDAVFYGNPQQLEYDFVIAPGASPRAIQLRFGGAKKVSLDKSGDLVLRLSERELRQRRPAVYRQRQHQSANARGQSGEKRGWRRNVDGAHQRVAAGRKHAGARSEKSRDVVCGRLRRHLQNHGWRRQLD